MQNATRYRTYRIEFGDQNKEPVGQTESIDVDFSGSVKFPKEAEGRTIYYFRTVWADVASEWEPVMPSTDPTLYVGDEYAPTSPKAIMAEAITTLNEAKVDLDRSSDATPVECSICLEMGAPRDPVCPGCIQIACDALKTARRPDAPPYRADMRRIGEALGLDERVSDIGHILGAIDELRRDKATPGIDVHPSHMTNVVDLLEDEVKELRAMNGVLRDNNERLRRELGTETAHQPGTFAYAAVRFAELATAPKRDVYVESATEEAWNDLVRMRTSNRERAK